jgi:hypothetical protein
MKHAWALAQKKKRKKDETSISCGKIETRIEA